MRPKVDVEDVSVEEEIPYRRLLDILQDYLRADMDAATVEYCRDDILRNICGCSDNEIRALGFGYILEEVITG